LKNLYKIGIIEKIPYKFIQTGRNISLEYKTVSIPKEEKINAEMDVFNFNGEEVILL